MRCALKQSAKIDIQNIQELRKAVQKYVKTVKIRAKIRKDDKRRFKNTLER